MQDRYTGDVGDFGKYGLLRAIAQPEITKTGGRSLKLGVVWYRYPDQKHNADGKHIAYLKRHKRDDYRKCDPDLYDCLDEIVCRRRAISEVEKSNILGSDTRFFSERCPGGPTEERREWHKRASNCLQRSDVVFLDPDNGLRDDFRRGVSGKHAYLCEVLDYLRQGCAVVFYHHLNMSGSHDQQIIDRASRLSSCLVGSHRVAALRYRSGTSRAFFVIWPIELHELFAPRLSAFCGGPWVAPKRFCLTVGWDDCGRWEDHSEDAERPEAAECVIESRRYRCPIRHCEKTFCGSRSGWDAHVGSCNKHPHWHPEITDPVERKRKFRNEYPGWFGR